MRGNAFASCASARRGPIWPFLVGRVPVGKLRDPGLLLPLYFHEARLVGFPRATRLQALQQLLRGELRVALDRQRNFFHQAERAVVGVDLDDPGILRPVVDAVLRQRAEGPEARAQREHDVRARDDAHRCLRSLVTERTAGERMVRRERVVVQVAIHHRRGEMLGERLDFLDAVRHHHAAARKDDGELRLGEHLCRLVERVRSARGALDDERRQDLIVALAVEVIARDVDLHRAALVQRDGEGAVHQFRHAQR